jgi:hypothetical protein
LSFAMRGLVAQSEAMLTSLPRVVEANGVDALLLDRVQFYLELGPMHLGIPYIHVSNALHFDFTGTHHSRYLIGPTRQILRPWPKTDKALLNILK